MTDNDMIKYLHDHGLTNGCSLGHHSGKNDLIADRLLSLVEENNRQKAEIEALIAGQETLQKCIAEKDAEIESITEKFNCQQTVYADLSKIIKDKNTEIEKLRELKEQLEVKSSEEIHSLYAEIRTLKKTNDSYTDECNKLLSLIPKARAEAVKEFSEKVKEKISCYDWVYVDELMKEMVGDEE